MLNQLFPEIEKHFSSTVVDLLDEWSEAFFAALDPDTTQEMGQRLVSGLEPAKVIAVSPVLSKLSQVLARDARLPEELRRQLCLLETSEPYSDYTDLTKPLQRSDFVIGKPLAEGSLAVVFGCRAKAQEAVIKLLKPDIEKRLVSELDALAQSVSVFQKRAQEIGLPQLDFQEIVVRVAKLLRAELDLECESKNLRQAYVQYNSDSVAIPRLLENTSPQALVMERLWVEPLRPESASTALKEMLIKPIFETSKDVLFHGDLHGGNILSTEDGRIGVLDWGLCLELTTQQRSLITRLTLAAILGRSRSLSQILSELGLRSASTDLSGSLSERLDNLLDGCEGVIPEWLVVLRKTVHQLEGLLNDVKPDLSIEQMLLSEGAQQLILE